MLQEQDTQPERNRERKGLKKKPGEIVWLESAKRKPLNMLNFSVQTFLLMSWELKPACSTSAISVAMGMSTLALQILFRKTGIDCKKFTHCWKIQTAFVLRVVLLCFLKKPHANRKKTVQNLKPPHAGQHRITERCGLEGTLKII